MKKRLEINKTAITVIGLNIFQIAAVLAVIIYMYMSGNRQFIASRFTGLVSLFAVAVFSVLINTYIAIHNIYKMKHTDSRLDLLKDTLTQVENLNNTLRAQRHDFMNHLQVVYSLMEMEEYKDAKEYIDKVYIDIQKVGKILKTSNPAINALLQAKILSCEKRNIKADLLVSSNLEHIKIPSWELCKVLGNLIDNSIYALEESKKVRTLAVKIYENLTSFNIKVINNGPMIPGELIDKIFEAGFTTKGEKGEGMGLAIAKDTLSEYGGDISVKSSESETAFDVIIPK